MTHTIHVLLELDGDRLTAEDAAREALAVAQDVALGASRVAPVRSFSAAVLPVSRATLEATMRAIADAAEGVLS